MLKAAMLKTAAAIVFALTLSLSANAMADSPKPVNVPAGDLTVALEMLEKQSGVEIVYRPELLKGIHTAGVKGTLSSAEAVTKLLEGTTLKLRSDRAGVLLITQAGVDGAALTTSRENEVPAKREDEATSRDRLPLAQVDQRQDKSAVSIAKSSQSASESSENKKAALEEIVVTAQKREERLIDVPISIVVMTADELEKRKIKSIDDLQLAVPGLAITSNGQQRRIQLRGISNGLGGSLPLIGVYLDEADITSGSTSQLDVATYDLERIEVLRGPQGTLYGEGSAGGTIRFITRDPQLEKFSFDSGVSALFTQDGGPSQRIEEAVNLPLIDNELGLRIAGAFDHDGGWINQPAAGAKDINGQNRTDVRVKGLWRPDPQFSVNAMAVIHRNDSGVNIGEDGNGNYTQTFGVTTSPRLEDDHEIYNLTLAYHFASSQILSTTSYYRQTQDLRNYGYVFPGASPPAPPFDNMQNPVLIDNNAFTQEIRASSIGDGPWEWTVGGFYRRVRNQLSNTFSPPLAPLSVFDSDSLSKSKSIFADTSYRFADRFTIGTGLRYFEDDQESASQCCAPGGALGTAVPGRFHSLDPRAYVQYKATDQTNLYVSAAKGFRSGGENALNQPSYGPETVWTYELGTKSSFVNGRFSTNAAIFYSDYTEYQITGTLPPPAPQIDITRNAGSARIKGVELDLTWHPSAEWMLSLNGNYLDTRFYEVNVTNGLYIVGDHLDLVPNHTFTASAERQFLWNGHDGFVRLDYNQQGRESLRARSIGPWFYSESDVINMLNVDSSMQVNPNLSLGVFAQNLLNDRGYTDAFSVERTAARSRPRTVGLQFNVKFD